MQDLDKTMALETALDLLGILSYIDDENFREIIAESIRNDDDSTLNHLLNE